MTEKVKLFTRKELESQNSREEAIIIIDNSVYDVTKFLDEHPGGEEVLLELAGQDATDAFEDISHSSDARSLMKKYKIGEVVEADRRQMKPAHPTVWNNDKQIELNNWSSWLVPLMLGLAATVLFRYLFL
ncbi:unnamed protein product, partial [Brenthis ino]